jgi:hypothetical protein
MPKGPERRTERITLRLPESLREALEREAERERRSVSDLIVILLSDAISKKGKQR